MAKRKASSTRPSAKGRGRGLQQPVHPDAALAKVVGREAQPRTEMTKRLWGYIKDHDLQDPDDGRVVRADDRLREIFAGKRKVSMFEIARHLNQHVH